jgi:NADPH:quinone reductase-like Zn-dependent oxidoreductase
MKAIVYTQYGPADILQLKEIEKPEPKQNEVLVRIHATTVNRTDNATIKAIPFFARIITGLFRPKKQTPGTEFSGEIESAGEDVSSFKAGDKVFGFDDGGAKSHAEYTVITIDKIAFIPPNISFEQAAACSEGAHYAYNTINKIDLDKVQSVLVNGATGAIGSAAVQLLKYFNKHVTAVCATENMEVVKSLGADHVIDYKKEDFTKTGEQYDFVFDAVGKSSFFKCWRLLKTEGVYASTDLGFLAQNMLLPLITPVIKPLISKKKTVAPIPVNINRSLLLVKNLIEQNKFAPLIDREYAFEDIIDAYQYVAQGQKIGNVVVSLIDGNMELADDCQKGH